MKKVIFAVFLVSVLAGCESDIDKHHKAYLDCLQSHPEWQAREESCRQIANLEVFGTLE